MCQIHKVRTVKICMLGFLLVTGLLLGSGSQSAGQDVKKLASDAGKAISASQRAMFSRKFDDAQKELSKAADIIEQIRAADQDFSQLNSLQSKYEKQKADLEKRLPKEISNQPVAVKKEKRPESQPDKLPSTVTHYLKDVDRMIEKGEKDLSREVIGSPEVRIGNLELTLKEANGTMDRIFSSYGDKFNHDHPDVKLRQHNIASFKAKIEGFKANYAAQKTQQAKSEGQKKAQSDEWLKKIRPYVTGTGQSGYDENKYLIGSGTANVDELVHRKKIYAQAKTLFEEYQKAEFPNGKTQELEFAEEELARSLKGFEEGYKQTLENFASEAGKEIDYAEEWLTKQEAESKGEKKPLYLHGDIIQRIKNKIFALEASASGEDSRLQALNSRLADVEKRAEKLRSLGVERTVMTPDKFNGKENSSIKTKASEFLHKKHPDAKVLRTTIISEDWSEERLWEYTDTTKSAVRFRITQSVTAQIAGKSGKDVSLYTIHVARDKRSDGSWGQIYGHVMFTDPMLEKNVKK
ncbi:MAG TPA: hypothetical protein PK874_14120 [Desulfobacteraceae bacterium]|nr:hypothetical protein [Desulfobacteraceae bacterium]HPJ69134.1 hypothetical protein [Desulfobacteraceae bacterium]HPQ28542.1 hypothetical protein [Desulfobacteraceae bacterium]